MTQQHARKFFSRVAVADARRSQIVADYRARWTGDPRPAYESARHRRLCRAAAMYRISGYMERR